VASLAITANAQGKTYGQTLAFGSGSTLFTSTGLQNGETIGTVTLAVSGNGGAATASVAGSPYTITPSAATGGTFNPANYSITYNTGLLTVSQAATSVAAVSSENPSGYLDSLTFTATVTPSTATGSVVFSSPSGPFSTNTLNGSGVATSLAIGSLARGTNVITLSYSGDVNYSASSTNLNQIVTNHAPVAATLTVTRVAGLTFLIPLTSLATNWSDVDGDTVQVTSVTSTTTNGQPISVFNVTTNAGAWVTATNAVLSLAGTLSTVNDQFSYAISDGHGGTNTGYVNIVTSTATQSGQNTSITTSGNGPVALTFYGIPGFTYGVQRSTNLVTGWVTIWTTNPPPSGPFNYSDAFGDLGGIAPQQAFYRLIWIP
jgi:hypothetical protein